MAFGAGGDPPPSQAAKWPTPRTISGGAESAERKKELGRDESGGGDLQAKASEWQTPATDSFRSRGGDRKDEKGLDQQARASLFSRPDQETPKGGPGSSSGGPSSRPQSMRIATGNGDWPTPNAQGHTSNCGGGEGRKGPLRLTLLGMARSQKRRLNPLFVEWLMGWPIGWTDCGPAGTASSPPKPVPLSESSGGG